MKNKPLVINFDLDGCLTKSVCWTPEECLNAEPNLEVIEKFNKLAETNFVYICTARRDHLIPETLRWLRRNGIMFQAISNNKSSADLYIDDLCKNIKDL